MNARGMTKRSSQRTTSATCRNTRGHGRYPARKAELTPKLIIFFWKTTIEVVNCEINSPTEEKVIRQFRSGSLDLLMFCSLLLSLSSSLVLSFVFSFISCLLSLVSSLFVLSCLVLSPFFVLSCLLLSSVFSSLSVSVFFLFSLPLNLSLSPFSVSVWCCGRVVVVWCGVSCCVVLCCVL